MGKLKEIANLEDLIFQTIESLYLAKQRYDKQAFILALGTLELLNHEYLEITGKHYITQERMIQYHSEQWEINWT